MAIHVCQLSCVTPKAFSPAVFFGPEDQLRASIVATWETRRGLDSPNRLRLWHHPHWGLKESAGEHV